MRKILLIILFGTIMVPEAFAQTFSVVAPNSNGYEIYYEVIDASHVAVTRPSSNQPYVVIDTLVNNWPQCLPIPIPDSVSYQGVTYCVSRINDFAFANVGHTPTSVLYSSFFPSLNVILPASISHIGTSAFCGNEFVSLYFKGNNLPVYSSNSFDSIVNLNIAVPCGTNISYWENIFDVLSQGQGAIFQSHLLLINDISTNEMGTITVLDTLWGMVSDEPYPYLSVIEAECEKTSLTLCATPREDYHFDHWSNGSTQCTTTVTLPYNTPLIAYFAANSMEYTLAVTSSDSTLGYTLGGGEYQYGDTAVITAIASEHYHFTHWSDGNSDNPRQYAVMQNDTLIAYFAIDTHTVNVTSCDITMGRVIGGGEFEYGAPCSISAEAYSGYVFSQWSNGATYNPYTFAVMEDTELTAIFVAEGDVGVDDIETDGIHIYSIDGHILVNGTIDEVRIFDIVGRNIRNEALPAGVYMVKIGNHPARKVVVIR